MKARITILTIAVDDLEHSLRFYRDGLGLPTEGIIGTQFEHGAVAFFELQGGLKLAAWARDNLSHDSGLPKSPHSPTEFSIGHNVASEREVDAVMEQASKAGARIVKRHRRPSGADTPATFRIRTITYGRWSSALTSFRRIEVDSAADCLPQEVG